MLVFRVSSIRRIGFLRNGKMKIISAIAVIQMFLLTAGSDVSGENKGVGCFYSGSTSEQHGTLFPEDIDASLCSHLLYVEGAINNVTEEIEIDPHRQSFGTGGFVSRLVKLKEVNGDLKLILLIRPSASDWILEHDKGTKFITNGVKWLNESGFDGLGFPLFIDPRHRDKMADFLCEMKTEFDKYGYILTSLMLDEFTDPTPGNESAISKVGRCCDYVTLIIEERSRNTETYRLAPMNVIKSKVDLFIGRGLPAEKIRFTIPAVGVYVILEDPNETELGAKYYEPGLEYREVTGWNTIRHKELLRKLNDSSLGWTYRRDKATQEPYAFSTTGLWTSYEDTASISFKARYVQEKGLHGMDIVIIDLDDDEGIGGGGRFPLTRAAYNTFRRGNQSLDAKP